MQPKNRTYYVTVQLIYLELDHVQQSWLWQLTSSHKGYTLTLKSTMHNNLNRLLARFV